MMKYIYFIFGMTLVLNNICHTYCADTEGYDSSIFVCEAGDNKFVGKYTASMDVKEDNVPIYSNKNEMSFYRYNGFWYLGDLEPWPPVTHYRCVEAEG